MTAKNAQALGGAVVGYLRVSTDRQVRRGISLELQETAQEFAVARGLPVIGIYRDVGSARGRASLQRRVELRRALQACQTQNAILVVWSCSRLSREVSTEDELLKLLPPPERVHSICEDETLGAARKHARFVHAQQERDLISERTKVAMDQRKRAGKSFGNPDIRKSSGQRSGCME